MLRSSDLTYLLVVDARLLYMVSEAFTSYFAIRGMIWDGEKSAVRHLRAHDPVFLDLFTTCIAATDRTERFGLYEQLARRAAALAGPDPARVTRTGVSEGVRTGLILSVCVVIVAYAGLSPSMSWVPEVPLLIVAALIPLAAFALAGNRAATNSQRAVYGAIAGGIAGAIGGVVGGVCYVLVGKPLLNVAVGLVLGAAGGATIGAAAAVLSLRPRRQ